MNDARHEGTARSLRAAVRSALPQVRCTDATRVRLVTAGLLAGLGTAVAAQAAPVQARTGDGSEGFVLRGIGRAGSVVSDLGDVNGDGIADLVVGAPGAEGVGACYVVFGRTTGFPPVFDLEDLRPGAGGDGSEGTVLQAPEFSDTACVYASGAGDLNGDGIDDVVLGERYPEFGNGSYLVFGRPTFPAEIDLTQLYPGQGGDGSEGVVFQGPEAHGASVVSDAGDLNRDGIEDLALNSGAAVYLVFGRVSGFPAQFELATLLPDSGGDGTEGFVLTPAHTGAASVSGAGDVNGDGTEDLLVGAFDTDDSQTYLVFGRRRFPALFPLASLYPLRGGDGTRGVVIKGVEFGDQSGVSVSDTGDINGDGIDDLLIGASTADAGHRARAGESYVLFGRGTFPAVIDLEDLFPNNGGDGSTGFVLKGAYEDDFSGSSVSSAGDVNGDGIDDVIVGVHGADVLRPHAGAGYVVFGRASGFPPVFDLRTLLPDDGGDGNEGFVIAGAAHDDYTARSVSSAGDVNEDGIDDLLVGAPGAAIPGTEATEGGGLGAAYVVFGRDTGFPAIFDVRTLLPPP